MSQLTEFNARQFSHWRVDLREGRLKRVATIMQSLLPGKLLDLGCSDGTFSGELLAEGWQVVGVEIGYEPAEKAAERGLHVVRADLAFPFPFSDRSFDCVLGGEIIEHVIDTDRLLSECSRVLRDRGTLIITTPNLASLENRARILFGRYPVWVDYRLGPDLPGHVRAYIPRVLRQQLHQHGFVVHIQTGNFVPIVPQQWRNDIEWPWLQPLGELFPNLAMDIIIVAQKTTP